MKLAIQLPLYTKSLAIIAVYVVLLSTLITIYEIDVPVRSSAKWMFKRIFQLNVVKTSIRRFNEIFNTRLGVPQKAETKKVKERETKKGATRILTSDQLALFDGTRSSKPVYLALLGQIFNVEKGKKHYAVGGGYSFFAGRDATRAFVTGDFSPEGLTDNVDGLLESELISIADWVSFYEKEYEFVGFLEGTYYDNHGRPTEKLKEVQKLLERAKEWKAKQLLESEVFPPCNSEWKKDVGGRVWCTNKSGGIKRDWVGVPRKLFSPGDNNYRCACVKNFGNSLTSPSSDGNRGDLDHPNLQEYDKCPSNSISCKLPTDND